MVVDLYRHQLEVIDKLDSGSILCGGVGSGKSKTALAYFFIKECQGDIKTSKGGSFYLKNNKPLYIITTARKRDTSEWLNECNDFEILSNVVIDSWNNIKKYSDVKNAFFIFDEQRVVGSGSWVKSFLKIAKNNRWILLSATPGDTWSDYIPVFIANGFYKNRSEFLRRHAVFNRYTKYPKIDRYVGIDVLNNYKRKIVVNMEYERDVDILSVDVKVDYDSISYYKTLRDRWNFDSDEPIMDVSSLCYRLRYISNSSEDRVKAILSIIEDHPKLIIFYNFDYELEALRSMCEDNGIIYSEWNGHKHEPIPSGGEWAYLVQYLAGAEGWNCVETDTMVFYSLNYSYKIMHQASGRINRMNSPFKKLYYYRLVSDASIDRQIIKVLKKKRNFNEKDFIC